MELEWDPHKAAANLRKHGISFNEASSVFGDPFNWEAPGPDHSHEESRFLTVGMSERNRLLLVSHTERGHKVRIISARETTRNERGFYETRIGKYN